MKAMAKYLLIIVAVSALMVLYVHIQISLFHVSYAIDDQMNKRAEKLDEFRRLKFEIDQLKAPPQLEKKMNELALGMGLPKEILVMRVPMPTMLHPAVMKSAPVRPLPEGVTSLFGRWIKVAQAQPDK